MGIYQTIVEGYQLNNFQERNSLNSILVQLNEKKEKELINRKNFVGHFTASAFVVSRKNHKILMVHHKVLKKYLQPGGHIEEEDLNPLLTARRELFEETGLTSEVLDYKRAEPLDDMIPFNISIHKIPENKHKREKAHYHYDLQYLFFSENEMEVTIDKNESNLYEWVEWESFKNMPGYKNIAKKIENLELSSQERFLSKIVSKNIFADISCVAIQHIIPSSIPFIKTLKKIFGSRLLICAKPNSINQKVWKELEESDIKLKVASRNDDFDEKFCNISGKTILIDIGGYFANISQKNNLPIVCIVEDTENGIQKYNKVINDVKYPVFSVARNPLKKNEDYLVGADIVFGADYILHQKNLLIQYMKVACIGYGRIGYGICTKLRELGIKPIVIEKNSIRAIQAIRDGCDVLLEKDFSNIDLIFCATGSKSLDILDFRAVKDGSYIVSATSSDDEFNLNYLSEEYKKLLESSSITKYESDDNYFYILNQGIPTNFAVDSALGNYILLIHAAILATIQEFIQFNKSINLHHVNVLSENSNQKIAAAWLKEFTN
ncbi:NUDIX domain-containing protein [Streptococcus sanguinis]|uniref:NUDIX domain-containing protein n=1 Tax=Streptococcus sanguinis TaxID=1305 RepID=A0A7H8V7J6_STRSA|nr:NUDIX domain-containing protein [Streptococcus sanguinis]